MVDNEKGIQTVDLYLSEQDIQQHAARAGRACGECSLCCLIPDIPVERKSKLDYCPHCRPGKGGCSIYADRPDLCKTYSCAWLVGSVPDRWRPLTCKMIIDFDRTDNGLLLRVLVHPDYPERWREEPWYSDIKKMALNGLNGSREPYRTVVTGPMRPSILVLPHEDLAYSPGVVVRVGPQQWQLIRTATDGDAQNLETFLMGAADAPNAARPET